MSDIAPISSVGVSQAAPIRSADRPTPVASPSRRLADQVEISDMARYLEQLRAAPEIRDGLVAEARAKIADGTYDSLDWVDHVMDEIARDLGM